ncbi:hypothetical protein N7492_005553 [Penicillium capsulatum]|uniref:Uncharacterized protein n=1 Tax=Penicillium capsulatum TaxID=69766 RepID=A0A9W9LS05_9EURO|nr:hypothetical protein N7492_005553 [Penicillium capsulatum]
MATITNSKRESWDSLSSTFANLEVSFSQDSCYGSDEVSVSSNPPAPLQSSESTYVAKCEEPSLHPLLKSILKKSSADIQSDTDSESGYGSDDIDLEYDALSEDEDEDMSDFSVWDETSRDVPETHQDHTDSFDDSFIGFETMVRFDTKVEYIDAPGVDLSDDEGETQMTCHEMMLLAQQSGNSQISFYNEESDASDDEGDDCHKEFVCTINANHFEDFSHDAVDVDRQLFVAYMNGIHGIADNKYKSYLRTQAANIRLGHETESMHPDDAPCMYLDRVCSHVIGIFRNLVADDELNDLIALRKEDLAEEHKNSHASQALHHHQNLLNKIEHVLVDRLTNGHVDVYPDELSFFAGNITQALNTAKLPASA